MINFRLNVKTLNHFNMNDVAVQTKVAYSSKHTLLNKFLPFLFYQ